ncbi:hypothetical protein niasHT_015924 [Heterodera trifolii]|uniref:Uncharacterized protein n=1 Tax=Heterodera trifolii TaxID=157864 RepID=A0ABD2KZ61_9BILA
MPFSAPLSAEEPMSLASLITGSNCLKTCGMEDVQFAARRASDLFVTIRVCAVVLTSLLALFFILMIALRIYTLNMRKKRSNICRGSEHFISRESKEDRKCCCSSSSSRPIPSKLSHCAELPNSRDTTAAATPLPIPPPSICCSRSAEDEGFCPFHALLWVIKGYLIFRFIKFFEIFVRSVWGHFFTRPLNLAPYKKSWTVVTGCTDGIGKAYLEELVATKGIRKLYLIARNTTKLEALCSYLQENYEGCEIKRAIFDFEKDDFEKLPTELQSLEVGILINCAGTGPDQVANFANLPPGLSSVILRVNLLSCVKMIELILPGMLQRDRGIVVNFSSITGWRPLPYMSSYPASKAAISFFTDSLGDEFAHTNVKIQCLFPLLVATKLTQYAAEDANLFVLDAKSYARQAVNIIGNYRISTGCFMHDMQIAFGSFIGFNLFKLFYVPFGILGIHKRRIDAYNRKKLANERNSGGRGEGIKSE